MELRNYKPDDCAAMAELFFDTVHTVNAKDYAKNQLDAWATGYVDISIWNKSFSEHHTVIAEIDGIITGFGDMDDTGYLDMLYVHRDYQRRGVATAIVCELEQHALSCGVSRFTTYTSITARPFFERRGYHVVRKNTAVRRNIKLTNYIMEKNTDQ